MEYETNWASYPALGASWHIANFVTDGQRRIASGSIEFDHDDPFGRVDETGAILRFYSPFGTYVSECGGWNGECLSLVPLTPALAPFAAALVVLGGGFVRGMRWRGG